MDELERYWIEKINAQVARAMEEAGLELMANAPEEGTVYEGRGVKVVVTVGDGHEKLAPVILSIDPANPEVIRRL